MKPLISAHNITVMRGRHALLQNVSLHVGERDFITVVGPNGAGKSTLLKCLLGFHAPDSGTVARARSSCIVISVSACQLASSRPRTTTAPP